jgi:hypothetical protein
MLFIIVLIFALLFDGILCGDLYYVVFLLQEYAL